MKTLNTIKPIRQRLKHLALTVAAVAGLVIPVAADPPPSPGGVTGLALWLDASDATTMTMNGTTVDEWRDKLGSTTKMTRDNGAPAVVASGIGGIPTVHFTNGSSMGDGVNHAAPVTVFYVSRQTGGSNGRVLSGGNNWLLGYWGGSKGSAYFEGDVLLGGNGASDTNPHLYATTIGGSGQDSTVWAEGVQIASNQNGTDGPNGLFVGGGGAYSEYSDCDISEVLVYNRILLPFELDAIGGYLTEKYSLTTAYPPLELAVRLTSPAVAEGILSGTSVSASANVTDPGAFTHTVTFHTTPTSPSGPTVATVSTDTTSPFTADLGTLAAGNYEIYATVVNSGDPVGTAISTTRTFTVAPADPTTTVLNASGPATTYGDSVTFTATVDPVPTGGTVQFLDGANYVGSPVAVNTTTGEASVSTTTLGAGTHEITAEYSGYQIFEASTSTSISQVVDQAPLTVTAQNVFRFPDTANPDPLPYEITGYQNGEDLVSSGVSGEPALSTTAVLASPVGDYPITSAVGTLAADNYSFTSFVEGTLTVVDPAAPFAINVNLDDTVQPGLEGPGGGLGAVWNTIAAASATNLRLANGPASTVGFTSSGTGGWGGPNKNDTEPTLRLLKCQWVNFGANGTTQQLVITGLDSDKTYDLTIASAILITSNQCSRGEWSTTNTTSTVGNQAVDNRENENGSTWVRGNNYVLFEDVVPDGSGNITVNGFAITEQPTYDIRLPLNGFQLVESVTTIAGPVNNAMSTVTATPAAVVANGVSASTVKVTLRDANGVRVANKQVTLANNGGLTPPPALTTNAQGVANFAVSSSTVGTVVFTATVVADNLTLTDTASVEFTDPEAPVAYNVNIYADTPATGLLGVVGAPGETWNQGTTSASNLIDSSGGASSVNVTGFPDGGYTVNAALNVFDDNRNFFSKGQDTTISITGLVPDTAYDLYIYSLSHNSGSWGDFTNTERAAGDFVTSNTVLGNGQSQWLDNGITGVNGDSFIANGNYVVFQSIVSNNLGNISVLADALDGPGSTRLHISGLQVRPATGMSLDYAAWRESRYPGLGMPDEDDDGDGSSNDYERIFGMNPTDPASASPYWSAFNRATGTLSYTRRVQSLINMNYKVSYSTDLINWFVDNAAIQTVESVSNDVEFMGVSIDPVLLSQPKLFVRVVATPITGLDPEPSLVNLWGSGNSITLLFSEPMNPSSAANPLNYEVLQAGGAAIAITGATLSSDGGSVTLTLASALGIDTGYTVNLDGVTSGTGQSLGTGVTRQFKTWDDNPNGIKVFILAGQSNMVGYGEVENGNSGAGTVGSLRYLAVNDASLPDYNYASLLANPSQPATSAFRTRSDVKVWWRDGGPNLGGTIRKGDLGPPFKGTDNSKIGPEFAFGHVMGDFYPSRNVLIVKIAWGGRSLVKDFRPPSAVAARGGRVGDFFSAIIDNTRDVLTNLDTEFPEWSGQGYQIVGFGWHQGFNDLIDTTASAEYKDNLPDLIKDVRTVFGKPNLPFVIASTGMDTGPAEPPPYKGYRTIEKAQLWVAGVPKPANVLSTDARPFWRVAGVSPSGEGYHWNWNAETYFLIGKSLGDNMVDLLPP